MVKKLKEMKVVPDRGDIILVACREPEREIAMLVLSPAAFNEHTGTLIGLLASPDEQQSTNPFAVTLPAPAKNPVHRTLHILCNTPQTVSLRKSGNVAMIMHVVKAPDELLAAACEALNQIIQIGE